jgi:CIC family chloride channel protein
MNPKNRQNIQLLVLAIGIGILSAVGAILFRTLIEFFQFLFWSSGDNFVNKVTNTSWYLTLFIPTAGGLIAGTIITFFVPEAKGPGVSEIIKSVARVKGYIRHRVTFLKALVSSLLLGSGASVGREGPIAQIGASVGSSIAQIFNIAPELHRVLLASGTAAGISATFNAPIAGTFFAIEIVLLDIEINYISHIMISSIVASVFSRMFWGQFPVFILDNFQLLAYWELLLYLVVGILAGCISILFVKLLFSVQVIFDRFPIKQWLKPGLAGLILGGLGLQFPHVLGVGYETMNWALAGTLGLKLALILLFLKMTATCISIGSGMSGGIFAPSLFLGSTLGVAVGAGTHMIFPQLVINPTCYALAGMGAVVSGTTLAPITAILTIFELTYNYHIILPLMVSCITSFTLVRAFFGYSVYEMKLLKQGINIVRGHDITILRSLIVNDFMSKTFETISDFESLLSVVDKMMVSPYPHFVVQNRNQDLVGVLSLRDIKYSLHNFEDLKDFVVAADLMSSNVITISAEDSLEHAMSLFETYTISFLPVIHPLNPQKVQGILKKDALLRAYDEQLLKNRILSGSFK